MVTKLKRMISVHHNSWIFIYPKISYSIQNNNFSLLKKLKERAIIFRLAISLITIPYDHKIHHCYVRVLGSRKKC